MKEQVTFSLKLNGLCCHALKSLYCVDGCQIQEEAKMEAYYQNIEHFCFKSKSHYFGEKINGLKRFCQKADGQSGIHLFIMIRFSNPQLQKERSLYTASTKIEFCLSQGQCIHNLYGDCGEISFLSLKTLRGRFAREPPSDKLCICADKSRSCAHLTSSSISSTSTSSSSSLPSNQDDNDQDGFQTSVRIN